MSESNPTENTTDLGHAHDWVLFGSLMADPQHLALGLKGHDGGQLGMVGGGGGGGLGFTNPLRLINIPSALVILIVTSPGVDAVAPPIIVKTRVKGNITCKGKVMSDYEYLATSSLFTSYFFKSGIAVLSPYS
jgi:hypothetical protein